MKGPTDDLDSSRKQTSEVGDEGGSPGDVEIEIDRVPGEGHEADETERPAIRRKVIVRDQTGIGRRSP